MRLLSIFIALFFRYSSRFTPVGVLTPYVSLGSTYVNGWGERDALIRDARFQENKLFLIPSRIARFQLRRLD